MGNWASRLGCLGERSRLRPGPKAQESPSPPANFQGLHPPGVSWAWWGTRAIQVTEVTETVVTETVVTEAVEVGPGQQGRQPAQVPPVLLNTLQSWLDGMEELQASQGPLAADATVAAAQLREQELLQCLLQERAPQIEPRLQEVGSPAKLRAQWHRLVQQAETRWGLLQQLVPAAQSFDAARETLLARLGPGERLLAELGRGHLGPKGQERVLQCLQRMCEGATAYAEDLGRALETGQRLAELLMEDEARLVRQQLEGLQECVEQTVSGAAQVWQTLQCAQRIGRTEPLPPTGLEAQLDLEGVASEGPGLMDQEQVSIQLAQLAEWLEQLTSKAEAPGQAAAPMVPIQKQCLPPSTLAPSGLWPGLGAVLQAELEALRGYWSETQEQDTGLKATWEPAQWIPCGLAQQAAIKKGLKPEAGWAPVLQEFPEGQQSLVVSWPWRGPAWRGGINFEGTCHLSLLMNLPGSQPAMSCPPRERPCTLEGTLLLISHIMEELLTCPYGSSQAEPLRTKSWRLEVLPGVLGADRLKPWVAAPEQVLTQRDLDQAGIPRVSQEDPSWLPWAEATMGSWSHWKLQTRERCWRDEDHLEQGFMDHVLAPGEQGRDGVGCEATSGGLGPTSQLIAVLESELPNSQQPPAHRMARAGDTDGDKHTGCQRWVHDPENLGEQVARGALMVRVGGGWVALDEFLVKNDPGRAKGRTSRKIHERFQCWVGAQSPRAQDIIALRLWTSVSSACTRPLPRKTGLPTSSAHRDSSPSKVKATEGPKKQNPRGHQDPAGTGQKAVRGVILRGLSRTQRTGTG
ncbi:PREDICTED: uncharacterized protein LOC102023873 isoform X2 [Chinchilla lanigera]|uniref:uncharacterized protein LOC102023873 isoform X2 n=1 Tax=Chinchilla lanigera TaxID=34839 RepID=UPI000696A9BB|nr:PREDICTED: uncharacterized protein LOC102023873 isoform X2 [Chinchilla lanigera]